MVAMHCINLINLKELNIMKTLDKVEIEFLKEDGYSDKEIDIINYYQSVKDYNNRSYYSGPAINFLFGDDYVKYNRAFYQIEIYTKFGLVELPISYEVLTMRRNRTKYAFDIAYKIRSILQSEKFYNEFFSIISNEDLKEDLQKVVSSRYNVCYSLPVNLTVDGYDKILNLIDSCLDDIELDENLHLPFNFYGVRYCILDALKKRLNLEYTEDLTIHLYGE